MTRNMRRKRLESEHSRRSEWDPFKQFGPWLVRIRQAQTLKFDKTDLQKLQEDMFSGRISAHQMQQKVRQLVQQRDALHQKLHDKRVASLAITATGNVEGLKDLALKGPEVEWRHLVCKTVEGHTDNTNPSELWECYVGKRPRLLEVVFRVPNASRNDYFYRYVLSFSSEAGVDFVLDSLLMSARRSSAKAASGKFSRQVFKCEDAPPELQELLRFDRQVVPGEPLVRERFRFLATNVYPEYEKLKFTAAAETVQHWWRMVAPQPCVEQVQASSQLERKRQKRREKRRRQKAKAKESKQKDLERCTDSQAPSLEVASREPSKSQRRQKAKAKESKQKDLERCTDSQAPSLEVASREPSKSQEGSRNPQNSGKSSDHCGKLDGASNSAKGLKQEEASRFSLSSNTSTNSDNADVRMSDIFSEQSHSGDDGGYQVEDEKYGKQQKDRNFKLFDAKPVVHGLECTTPAKVDDQNSKKTEKESVQKPHSSNGQHKSGSSDGQHKSLSSNGQHKSGSSDGQHMSLSSNGQHKSGSSDGQHKSRSPDGQHKSHSSNGLKLELDEEMCHSPKLSLLSQEVLEFSALVQRLFKKSFSSRQRVLQQLHMTLKDVFPCAKLQLFGSVAYGVALPETDLDVFYVHSEGVPCEQAGQYAQSGFVRPGKASSNSRCLLQLPIPNQLELLHQHLWKQPWCARVHLIKSTRVPVVKFTACPSAMKFRTGEAEDAIGASPAHHCPQCCSVDLSCGHSDGHSRLDSVRFIRTKLLEYPALAPLLTVLKQFLWENGLSDPFSGGLGAFPLILLIVRYLQSRDVRPVSPPPVGSSMYRHFVTARHGASLLSDSSARGWESEPSRPEGRAVYKHLRAAPVGQILGVDQVSWQPHGKGAARHADSEAQSAQKLAEQPLAPKATPSTFVPGPEASSTLGSQEGLGEMLVGFFNYYGNGFDPRTQGISVVQAGVLYPIVPDYATPMFLDNPLVPGHNVAAGTYRIGQVLCAFRDAYNVLTGEIQKESSTGSVTVLRRLLKIKWGNTSRELLQERLFLGKLH